MYALFKDGKLSSIKQHESRTAAVVEAFDQKLVVQHGAVQWLRDGWEIREIDSPARHEDVTMMTGAAAVLHGKRSGDWGAGGGGGAASLVSRAELWNRYLAQGERLAGYMWQRAALRDALVPFLDAFDHISEDKPGLYGGDNILIGPKNLTLADIWRARRMMKKTEVKP